MVNVSVGELESLLAKKIGEPARLQSIIDSMKKGLKFSESEQMFIEHLLSIKDSPNYSYESPNTSVKSTFQDLKTPTTATQLRAFTEAFHDQYKAQWDKGGVIQFKNESVAILHRKYGEQVQFIAAYDKITKEGFRLMAIDEGMTVSSGGLSGGVNAYYYFQKIDYVK